MNPKWNKTMDTNGGFVNEPNETASPGKAKQEAQRLQSVVPICIRQVRDHPEDEFKLFGMQTQILTLVGILKEHEILSTKATYKIEDHTGTISAIWWLESDTPNISNLPVVNTGDYVRVFGSLRVHEGEKMLMVLRMLPIIDINEITTHLLEVMHTRFEAEELSKGNENISRIKMNNPGLDLANSMSCMSDDPLNSDTGLTTMQLKVYNILKECTSASGMSTNSVLSQFAGNQQREVRAALEFLTNEGHVYSTIDNDHHKATESM